MRNNIYKQTYKGFTLFINNTHFGIELVSRSDKDSPVYQVPLQDEFSPEDHIEFLKSRIDLYTRR